MLYRHSVTPLDIVVSDRTFFLLYTWNLFSDPVIYKSIQPTGTIQTSMAMDHSKFRSRLIKCDQTYIYDMLLTYNLFVLMFA